MKNSFSFSFFLTLLLSCTIAKGQNKPSVDSLLTGVWQGTSICQVKNSPCHDEIVVYHISRSTKPNTFVILMNKIVKNKEEEMGTLTCRLNRKTNELTSKEYNAVWTFLLSDRKLSGSLYVHNALYRVIEVTKKN